MAATKKAGHAPAKPEFLVTYGTGGLNSSTSLQVVSLRKLRRILRTEQENETNALYEPWEAFVTPKERFLQHRKIESTFPFIVVGAIYDEDADLADEEDEKSGWQNRSGLVILTFSYRVVKGDARRTAASREHLQNLLLSTPLLGPSIVGICKELGACRLHVLVAAGDMPDYARRVQGIVRYVLDACPKLSKKIYDEDLFADTRYPIGNDPQAWLRPRPVGGYTTFPFEEAREQARVRRMVNARKKLASLCEHRQRAYGRA